ncbi:hypothetical protein [Acidihalobacter prosperus]
MPGVAWDNEFAYLQARVRARASALPREEDWAALGPLNEAEHYLQRARASRIAALLPDEILRPDDIHAFEGALRRRLHRMILELLHWAPHALAELVECCALLPYVAFFEHLRRGGETYAWLESDPGLDDTERALGHALVERGRVQDRGFALLWRDLLDERLKALQAPAAMHELLRPVLERHPLFEAGREVEARFYRTLRIEQTSLAQVLAYSGLLVWLGMRLRGELVQRQVFATAGGVR